MKIAKQDCCGCHACASVCPKQCISMEQDAEGFLYPKEDEALCVKCGMCEAVCPVLNPVRPDEKVTPAAYAAVHPDDQIRAESSSGGVFSALAQEVLDRKGIVFGAAWTEDFRQVRHIAVESEAELSSLRGSKYLQSEMGDCYVRARSALKEGRAVLFSGTPCQVEGLHTFLGREYENLLLVDIVCHGVPAPAVWQRYLAQCSEAAGAGIRSVSFRNKQTGWKKYKIKLAWHNGAAQALTAREDPFMQAFLGNACLRPSCYNCRFKKASRVSDLTLADFWGIEDVCPEMDDDRGTSLVLVHSEKGGRMLEKLKLQIRQVALEEALKGNPSAVSASPAHPNREAFLAALDTMPFEAAVKTWVRRPVTLKNRIGGLLESLGLVDVVKKLLGRE